MIEQQLDELQTLVGYLVNLAWIILFAIAIQVIAKLAIWHKVITLLDEVMEFTKQTKILIRAVEQHGGITDTNKKRIVEAAEQIKDETVHVTKVVEEAKTKLGVVGVDVKEIKQAVIDGSKLAPPHSESKP